MIRRPASTNLKITLGLLRRIHEAVLQYYPNEYAGLVTGYRLRGWTVATGLIQLKTLESTPDSVRYNLDEVMRKMKRHYVVGQVHSHPCQHPWSRVTCASEADFRSYLDYCTKAKKRFGRIPYEFIYAYPPGILNVYCLGRPIRYVLVMEDEEMPTLRPV